MALLFGAVATLAGGTSAPLWALLSLVMVAGWVVSSRPDRRRRAAPVDPDAARPSRRLAELLEGAPGMPLVRGQVRVGSVQVYDLVAELRSSGREPDAVLTAAEAVEEEVRHAMPVALTDEVRISQERLAEHIAGLRAAGA